MRGRLFLPWVALTVGCLVWMWLVPGGEVVPFHLIWIAFALAYGFEAWALAPTVVALLAATVTSGSILVLRAATGVIAWEETTEILLMLLLAVLVVWHVQRRQAALATVTLMADREAAVAAQRVRLARLTSHEMRTPVACGGWPRVPSPALRSVQAGSSRQPSSGLWGRRAGLPIFSCGM